MIKNYLKEIKKNKIGLISYKCIDGKRLNTNLFPDGIPKDFQKHKEQFLERMSTSKNKLEEIREKATHDKTVNFEERKIIEYEAYYFSKIIDFLKSIYDVEANKLDDSYKTEEVKIDYDYYNKLFFGVTNEALDKEVEIKENQDTKIYIKKETLEELIEYSKNLIPEAEYIFQKTPNLSHKRGKLIIPKAEIYNLRTVIVLFFHEMTHFIRRYNGKRNLGFSYVFSDYNTLEEGIAQFNEYHYGNKIIKYGDYNPYYDKCLQIIKKDISKKEKIDEIYEILKHKGFSRKKSKSYYTRFHRFIKEGSDKLFLRELIYTQAYNNVIDLIREDEANYHEIMKGKVGTETIKHQLIKNGNNINAEQYFKKMFKEIKKVIK